MLNRVIAENSISALDAIHVLLGFSMANRHLIIFDYGKHNYTILFKK